MSQATIILCAFRVILSAALLFHKEQVFSAVLGVTVSFERCIRDFCCRCVIWMLQYVSHRLLSQQSDVAWVKICVLCAHMASMGRAGSSPGALNQGKPLRCFYGGLGDGQGMGCVC